MNRDYKILAIDFDGTLCKDDYPNIGKSRDCIIEFLKNFKKNNPKTKYILWTCRRDEYLENAKQFCKDKGLEIDYYNENTPEIIEQMGGDSRKIFADLYLDDRNVNVLNTPYMSYSLYGHY